MVPIKLGLVAIALVVGGLPALADGPPAAGSPAREPYPQECCVYREFSWTGIFVGGQVGGGFINTDWTVSSVGGFSNSQTSLAGGAIADSW